VHSLTGHCCCCLLLPEEEVLIFSREGHLCGCEEKLQASLCLTVGGEEVQGCDMGCFIVYDSRCRFIGDKRRLGAGHVRESARM
jgi:hypothetical protein